MDATGRRFVEPTSWAWKATMASVITVIIPTSILALIHTCISTLPEGYTLIDKSFLAFLVIYGELMLVAGAILYDRGGRNNQVFTMWEFYAQALVTPLFVILGTTFLSSYIVQTSLYFIYLGLAWLVTFGVSSLYVRETMGDF